MREAAERHLGSLGNPEGERHFYQIMEAILRKIVNQLVSILNKPRDLDTLLANWRATPWR